MPCGCTQIACRLLLMLWLYAHTSVSLIMIIIITIMHSSINSLVSPLLSPARPDFTCHRQVTVHAPPTP